MVSWKIKITDKVSKCSTGGCIDNQRCCPGSQRRIMKCLFKRQKKNLLNSKEKMHRQCVNPSVISHLSICISACHFLFHNKSPCGHIITKKQISFLAFAANHDDLPFFLHSINDGKLLYAGV